MASRMDDEHAFARLEQRLASEDPALAQRMQILNGQFTDGAGGGPFRGHGEPDPIATTSHADEEAAVYHVPVGWTERSRTWKVTVALAVLAAIGLLLTAILSAPGGERRAPQPYGMVPAASQHAEDRFQPVLG
ncbi:hypothetical protein [Streptomyces bullii]|uniref:DUF3040 domain-containing protein n=1 Tax=Streptomyces bullii TaxID=349910 RepID=A0ABW0V0G5_9ACTN